jgi:hypothetical protein
MLKLETTKLVGLLKVVPDNGILKFRQRLPIRHSFMPVKIGRLEAPTV